MSRNYEKIIENLTSIIENTPFEGERVAAETQLKKILKSTGITMDDLKKKAESGALNGKDYRIIKLHRKHKKLAYQILQYYRKNILGDFHNELVEFNKGPDKGNFGIYATEAEAIECQAIYEFYYQAYERNLKIFYLAFIHRNDLGTVPNPEEPKQIGNPKPDPDCEKIAEMMMAMEKAKFPSKARGNDSLMIGCERKSIKA